MPRVRDSRWAVGAPKKKIGDWSTSVGHILQLRKGSTILGVTVTHAGDGDWTVVALTTPAKAKGVQAVLDQHAHQLIGTWPLADALQRAEHYARAWAAGKIAKTADCACDDITPRAARPARPASSGPRRVPSPPSRSPRSR